MIKLERSLLHSLQGDQLTAGSLCTALQGAIELEHSTIPLYLYGLFSLRPGQNRQIAEILKSVVVEEMLHMVLASNVLNALGGSPAISKVDFVPRYPGRLPGGVEDQLVLHLRPFSPEQLQAFIEIEEPRNPIDHRTGEVPEATSCTIGEFYTAIAAAITTLGESIFVVPPRNQVGPDLMYGSISVTDVASALAALDTIVEQGEGTGTSPEEIDGPGGVDDYAHYYRFTQIQRGRTLVRARSATPDDSPRYEFAGDEIPFDPRGVFALPEDPSAANYPVGSPARRATDAFNYTYTTLLALLHELVNGSATMATFVASLNLMESLEYQARAMVSGVAAPGQSLGPSFEYQPVDPGAARAQ